MNDLLSVYNVCSRLCVERVLFRQYQRISEKKRKRMREFTFLLHMIFRKFGWYSFLLNVWLVKYFTYSHLYMTFSKGAVRNFQFTIAIKHWHSLLPLTASTSCIWLWHFLKKGGRTEQLFCVGGVLCVCVWGSVYGHSSARLIRTETSNKDASAIHNLAYYGSGILRVP